MILETMQGIILGIGIIGVILSICFMIKNDMVYNLRMKLLREAIPGEDSCLDVFKILDRYTYSEMLYTFRSLKSFEKELLYDIRFMKGDVTNDI